MYPTPPEDSAEQLRLLVETVHEHAVFLMDADRRVTSWNGGAERLLGYSESEALGMSGDALVAKVEGRPSGHGTAGAGEETRDARWHVRRDGSQFWGSSVTTALRAPDGSVRGFACVLHDETPRRNLAAALRTATAGASFRAELADRLRLLTDPVSIEAMAARVLSEHLGASHAHYAEVEADAHTVVARDYTAGETGTAGRCRIDNLPTLWAELQAGRTYVVSEAPADERLTAHEQSVLAALPAAALVVVPLVKNGRLRALFAVRHAAAYAWTPDEVALVEETAERAWSAIEQARAETAQRDSEAQYRTLFESMGEGFLLSEVLYDPNGQPADIRYLEANPAAIRMTGDDYTGQLSSALGDTRWVETWARVDQSGCGERHTTYTAARQAWYDLHVFPAGERGSGRVAHLVQDVTERKRQETLLTILAELADDFAHLSAESDVLEAVGVRLHKLLNVSSCYMAEIDKEARTTTVDAYWSLPGQQSLVGVHQLSDFLTPDLEQVVQAGDTLVVRDTQTDPQTNAAACDAIGIHAIVSVPFHRDGEWRYLFSVTNASARDWREDEIELIREVTSRTVPRLERARAEAALRDSEARFRAVADLVPDLLWRSGPAGERTWGNRRWTEFTGQTLDQTAGYGWAEAIHPDDREHAMAVYREALRTGAPVRHEYRIRRADGAYRWFLAAATAVGSVDGTPTQWFGAATDIHEQRTARETLEARVEERTQQVRTLARALTLAEQAERRRIAYLLHDDLQQRLYGLSLTLGMLRQRLPSAEQAELVDMAEATLGGAARLTRTLSHEMAPSLLKQDDLADLLAWIADRKRELNGLDIEVEVRGDLSVPDRDIRVLIYQLLQELLFNVAKHSGTHQARLVAEQADGALRISVEDDGAGFDLARLDARASGLGLPSVRERLELFGGRLDIESSPGAGTRISFTVPPGDAPGD